MLPNVKSIIPATRPWDKKPIGPQSQIKYTEAGNVDGNTQNYNLCCSQERVTTRVLSESYRLLDEVNEKTCIWKRESDHQIKERVDEVKFLYNELVEQRKTAAIEAEALVTYIGRINNALKQLERAVSVNHECLILRQGRLGIDLCVDDVEKKLLNELKAFKGAQTMLEKTKAETTEQLRLLREAIYQLDDDLRQKLLAMQIDQKNLELREFLSNLGEGIDRTRQFCNCSLLEWYDTSDANVRRNTKELVNAGSLRCYVDLILSQTFDDVKNAVDATNFIFKRRIHENQNFILKLQERHKHITDNIMEVINMIKDIEEKIVDKERALLLCRTRLSNRSYRTNQELTCDYGQQALLGEQHALEIALCKLKQKLEENKAVMRYQKHTSIVIEEDLNIKMNSCKIDEVDCMVLRETLKCSPF